MRGNERGFTLLELLVAAAIFMFVSLALGSLFLGAVRATNQGTAASFVERQGTLLQDEMARLILPGSGLPVGTCGGGAAWESQVVRRPAPLSWLCFFRGTGDGQIYVCDWSGTACSNTRNLLAGSPVPIRADSIRFIPLVLVGINSSLDVTFTLQPVALQAPAGQPNCTPASQWAHGCLTFGMNVTVRN